MPGNEIRANRKSLTKCDLLVKSASIAASVIVHFLHDNEDTFFSYIQKIPNKNEFNGYED